MKPIALAGLLALAPLAAHAEGCAPEGGVEVASFEAMNQLMLDSDFAGFAGAIQQAVGTDVAEAMGQIGSIFADGFDGCTTIAQRVDTGGMVQNLVVFHGKPGPLFGYWMGMPDGDGYRVLSFNINTDLDKVMSLMR